MHFSQYADNRAPDILSNQAPPRIVLIGFGAIGSAVAAELTRSHDKAFLAGVVISPNKEKELSVPCTSINSIAEIVGLKPNLVVECAGHDALRDYGTSILDAGIDLMIVSTGALADRNLEERLISAARQSQSHIEIPGGAIGGVDAISAARHAGLSSVRHTIIKPARAWKGTAAAAVTDLEHLSGRKVFFRGSAREAAQQFPKNANASATIALAGLGLDRTQVTLVADPAAELNTHEVEIEGQFGTIRTKISSKALADNPRSSSLTAYSVVHAVHRRTNVVRI